MLSATVICSNRGAKVNASKRPVRNKGIDVCRKFFFFFSCSETIQLVLRDDVFPLLCLHLLFLLWRLWRWLPLTLTRWRGHKGFPPSPRKQEAGKKPDTPTSMLNVAGKKQKSSVLTVSGNISSSSSTVDPASPCLGLMGCACGCVHAYLQWQKWDFAKKRKTFLYIYFFVHKYKHTLTFSD